MTHKPARRSGSHDPEADAAAYLGSAMSLRQARRFEAHLVDCEACWREIAQAQLGRRMAESARELPPPGMSEDIRAALELAPSRPRHHRRGLRAAAMLGAAAFAAAAVLGVSLLRRSTQPEPIAAAVADFTSSRIPVSGPSHRPGPDLSGAGLSLVGSGSGSIGGMDVDAYAYAASGGERVLIYESTQAFPPALGVAVAGSQPWLARDGRVEMLCSDSPVPLLALAQDPGVLGRVGSALGIRSPVEHG